MPAEREFAAAKINLALHVTGRRPDGYHTLQTLAAFATIGDHVEIEPADDLAFRCVGPNANGLAASSRHSVKDDVAAGNLVIGAAKLLSAVGRDRGIDCPPIRLTLTKNLPVASGVGGGSADAAAALRLLNRFWNLNLPHSHLAKLAAPLGADVPMCVHSVPLLAGGVGDQIEPLSRFPEFGVLLANPGASLPTARVFAALDGADKAPLPAPLNEFDDKETVVSWLAASRNDLTEPAISIVPHIADVINRLRELPDALIVRMSGSGATCFALFDNGSAAERAAAEINHDGWWVRAGTLAGA